VFKHTSNCILIINGSQHHVQLVMKIAHIGNDKMLSAY